ncbi:MAG: hypothetical protein J5629_04530 [Muribaculaceae bacterium]|nr:hypothetical protein [Muribaculaceae bacterium]
MKKTVLLLFAIFLAMSSQLQNVSATTITPAEGEMWWGYFGDNDVNASNFGAFGYDSQADYEAAIRIVKNDPVMGGATIKAVRLWLNATTIPKITSLKIWVSRILRNNAQGVTYVQEVDLSTLTAGANDIALTTPYAINNYNNYVGFTMTLNGQDYPIMCGGEYETNSFFFRSSVSQTSWGSVLDHGKLALQVLAEGVQMPDNYAIAFDFGTHYYQKDDEAIIPVKIQNKGKNPITSVSYIITDNGDASTATPEVTVPVDNLQYASSQSINISFDTSVPMKGTKNVIFTKVNGEANEATTEEATANGEFYIKEFMFPKVPVVEEFTGTWCGWCPRGFVGMEMAHEIYGDRVVLIAAHSGSGNYPDPMQISDYSPILNTVSGFPDSRIDRGSDLDPNPEYLQNALNPLLETFPDGKVDITAKWDDEAMSKININTSSMFAYNEQNANYGIALVLIEDGLHGTSTGWAQYNYFSGQSGYPSYMSWWCSQGSPVSGVTYNHVAVAAWNIQNGFNGSVPTSFSAGEALPFNYVADITGKTVIQDKTQLTVAALLIDRSTGKIINAAQTTIKPYGTVEVPSEFYLVGTFNDWNQTENGGRLVFTATENEGIYEAQGTLQAGAEFKVITPNGDGWTWYGGQDDNGVGYFLINSDLLNAPLAMVDGANFRIENGGEFTFCVNANDMTLTVIPMGGPVVPGDVNGDGVVTATDVTLLYNYMLNNDDEGMVNGDVDGDGNITSADVTFIYNILLGNVEPTPQENVYVLGEVNGNTWGAATGVQMNTTNGKVFTVQVTTTSIGDGYATSYFALTKALASTDDNWDEIQDKRFGPTTADEFTNFVISDAVLGQEIPLVTTDWRAFEAPTGTVYNLTVDLEHMTIVITKVNP